jgi:hypothetical protein
MGKVIEDHETSTGVSKLDQCPANQYISAMA